MMPTSEQVNDAREFFLPESPNPIKRARIISLGATVEEVEWKDKSLGNAATAFAEEHDYYFLNDGSDDLVPAGTATIAAEILDELLQGVRTLLYEEHLVAEAAGAAATAAYLQNPTAYAGRTVVLLVTGANIPHELLSKAAKV